MWLSYNIEIPISRKVHILFAPRPAFEPEEEANFFRFGPTLFAQSMSLSDPKFFGSEDAHFVLSTGSGNPDHFSLRTPLKGRSPFF